MGLTKQLLDDMQTWEQFDHATEMYFLEQEHEYELKKQNSEKEDQVHSDGQPAN